MAKKKIKTELTPADRKAYMETGGKGKCPFCGSISVVGSSWDIDGAGVIAFQTVSCSSCEAEWIDEYRLCNIVVLQAPVRLK